MSRLRQRYIVEELAPDALPPAIKQEVEVIDLVELFDRLLDSYALSLLGGRLKITRVG